MADKHIRMVIEFDVDEEALFEHNISAKDVLNGLTFHEDDASGGFFISTKIHGLDPTSHFFLCEGAMVSKSFILGRSKGDVLDDWREMIRKELDINGVTIHGLLKGEVFSLISDEDVINYLANRLEVYLQDCDTTEYAALDKVFEEDFPGVLSSFRNRVHIYSPHFEIYREGDKLMLGSTEVFADADGNLFCQFPDEKEPRPLRDRIMDICEGDAFFVGSHGLICTSSDNSHQNFDGLDDSWIIHGDDGDCYFEEDIGTDFGARVREYFSRAQEQEKTTHEIYLRQSHCEQLLQKPIGMEEFEVLSNLCDMDILSIGYEDTEIIKSLAKNLDSIRTGEVAFLPEYISPLIKASWVDLNEGWNGDYNFVDPLDEKLLRFDISVKCNGVWEPLENASFCTCFPVDSSLEDKCTAIRLIGQKYNEFLSRSPEVSIKGLGEWFSHISPEFVHEFTSLAKVPLSDRIKFAAARSKELRTHNENKHRINGYMLKDEL